MQIVIDIPEEDYEYLKTHNKHGLYSSILNGTPLPKGHGRLIDADKIKYWKNDRPNEIGFHYAIKYNIDNTPTIIEADAPDINVGNIESEVEE